MHFLGAVIGAENEDGVEDILADWSEYADVDEYIAQTRDEILSNGRAEDRDYLKHGKDMDARKAAAERVALDDKKALKAYAEYCGLTLNANGDAVSTFNRDSFYDWYEIGGRWQSDVNGMQGVTCHELLERYRQGDENVRHIIEDLCVICEQGWYDGGLWNDTETETVLAELEQDADRKVWFVDFHD